MTGHDGHDGDGDGDDGDGERRPRGKIDSEFPLGVLEAAAKKRRRNHERIGRRKQKIARSQGAREGFDLLKKKLYGIFWKIRRERRGFLIMPHD